jgi:hypothetical protein
VAQLHGRYDDDDDDDTKNAIKMYWQAINLTPVSIVASSNLYYNKHSGMGLSGTEGNANASIYTDCSKTRNHVGASMVAVKDSREIHNKTQRLDITCTVFQAELCGIRQREGIVNSCLLNQDNFLYFNFGALQTFLN